MMVAILHVTKLEVMPGYRLKLTFNNGAAGVVDLSADLEGPIFGRLKDPRKFAEATLGYGAVLWSDDIDLAPEYLLGKLIEQGGVLVP